MRLIANRPRSIHECTPQAQGCIHRRYRYKNRVDEMERAKNRTKSTVRSKVEHGVGVMKLKFGLVKLRDRGLWKNPNQSLPYAGW